MLSALIFVRYLIQFSVVKILPVNQTLEYYVLEVYIQCAGGQSKR